MKTSLKTGVSVALLAWSAATGAAVAQQTTTPNPAPTASGQSLIGDIVVTARRREEALQRCPSQSRRLSGESLEERHIVDVAALQGAVPTLTFSGRRPNCRPERPRLCFARPALFRGAGLFIGNRPVRRPRLQISMTLRLSKCRRARKALCLARTLPAARSSFARKRQPMSLKVRSKRARAITIFRAALPL